MAAEAQTDAERNRHEMLAKDEEKIEAALTRLLFKYERELRVGELSHLDLLAKANSAGRLNTWVTAFASGQAMALDNY
jgi:hypothetical protein